MATRIQAVVNHRWVRTAYEGYRLSPQQQRLWDLCGLHKDSDYLAQCALLITGPLDPHALHSALVEVVGRNEILRTTFRIFPVTNSPAQVIADLPEMTYEQIRLAGPAVEPVTGERLLAAHRRQPFDLSAGPVLKATLATLDDQSHVLALTAPSLCADITSLSLMLRMTARLYRDGQPQSEADAPLQYADLAQWLNELVESDETAAGRAYWRDLAAGCGQVRGGTGELGAVRPASLATRPLPAVTASVGSAAMAALDDAAAACGVSSAAILLTCWRLAVSQLVGGRALTIGVTVPGRENEDLRDALGPLAGVVPVLFPAGAQWGTQTFRQLASAAGSALDEAARWQPYFSWSYFGPAAGLCAEDGPGASSVAFDHYRAGAESLGQDTVMAVTAQSATSDWAGLRLSCLRRPEDLVATIHCDAADLGEPSARRLLDRFSGLVARVGEVLDQPAQNIDLITAEERAQVLGLGMGEPAEPVMACAHELFEAQAARSPGRTALVCGTERLTYAELDRRSSLLAESLRGRGVGPDILVGLCVRVSVDLIVAILGIWKAGGAYLPLAVDGPWEWRGRQLRDAGVRLIVTESALLTPVTAETAEVFCLDREPLGKLAGQDPAGRPRVAERNLVYAIYTSGSTGGPKGVMIEHRSVVQFWSAMRRAVHGHPIGDTPRQMALNAALTFDASIQQIVTLFDGHTLHLLPDELRRDDQALLRYTRSAGLEVLNGTPTQVEALVTAGLLDQGRHPPVELLIAGEAVSPSLWSALRGAAVRAHNIYGPTECTVNATATAIAAAGPAPVIGRPLPGYQVLVLDERLRPVPLGLTGEIFIGGPGLARGYLGQPGLTAERFVPHPLAATPGERLYRTGDLGRLRDDGHLEFLGRRDNQLKLRGFRIEPGEIEEALRTHAQVRDALLLADDQPGGRRLVAYLVPVGDVPPDVAELRAFLGERLPDYMVPGIFVPLRAFPRTVSGKLDRGSLPAPDDANRARARIDHVAPRDDAEETLAAIWAKVLAVGDVGIDDNFFALGGDSIRAIRLRAQATERGLPFSVQELFEHQTIRQLAELVGARDGASVGLPGQPGTPGAPGKAADWEAAESRAALVEPFALLDGAGREQLGSGVVDAYPLTRTQAGMVYQSERHPAEALFCNTRTAHLRGPMKPDAIRAALAGLAAAHPALRASFDLASFKEPVQIVWAAAVVPLRVDDISALEPGQQEEFIAAFCADERATGFGWSEPPFLRLALHRRSPQTFQVTVTLHEAVLDGWSVATLLTELLARYREVLGMAAPVQIPPAELHREAVAAERRALADPDQAAFWAQYLAGAPEPALPRWPVTPAGEPGRAHHVLTVPVTAATAEGLRALAARSSLPLKSVLLAVHLYVTSRLADAPSVMTGLVANARPEVSGGDRALGQFLSVLPLRATVVGGSWADLARQVFEAEVELLPFRCYPAAHVRHRDGRLPAVDAAFNFTEFHVYEGLEGKGFERLADDFFERTDLSLLADFSVDTATSRIGLTLNCNGLPEQQVAAAAHAYRGGLEAMAANADAALADHDRQAYLAAPLPGAPAAGGLTLAPLFEQQARSTPAAIAVRSAAGPVTYQDLNERANRLARLLMSEGASPETLVGVAASRTAELLVAILAIFKAGAAYFPLNGDDPPGCLARLLGHSGVRLILTDSSHRLPVEAALSATAARGALPAMVVSITDERCRLLPGSDPPPQGRPGHLAYAVATSGSTGEPKVVLITQSAMVNHLRSKVDGLQLSPADRVAQLAPATFDVSVWQFLAALLAGGTVVIVPDDDVADPDRLLPALADRAVTVAAFVPSLLQAALATGLRPSLPSLRCLVTTGEPLRPALARRWLAAYPHTRLVNAYGPAECADNVTQQDIPADAAACPIGRPVAQARIYLLSHTLMPVPRGMPGQVCIGGLCLGRGYLCDAARTAAAFVPDPFVPGERMYLTGDRAYEHPDGALEYLGRSDRQVKIHGVRIEPGAVEATLASHPAVTAALVRPAGGPGSATQLAAYLVCGDSQPRPGELSAYLSERLPASLVPTRYVYLPGLPLGARGKVDETALMGQAPPAAEAGGPAATDPVTETERVLVRIWAGVLGAPPPTLEHTFFGVGGDSVRAVQLLARIRRELGADLSLRAVLAAPTVAGLASLVSRTADAADPA